ncbi:DUF4232 domain-containing protein [Streptomyces sp. NBC_00201]|uniref:DUF4232 domain-containing protein n=1 Tax=unclassified Streptomyces TaxID=2593676 RepID=UPI00225480C9|nr:MULTISPECIES: DUF4232 domain-containing protein [unclassified Streptomyces]MCX5251490.1 DUF4232 domain-containing protein [Streptomyces sp. NBC_00201]MCX5294586.1 DUF4232 domain-containing protein [Streptomyces sp. NBC_00183]
MTKKSPSVHRTALLASAVAVLGVLTACGSSGDGSAASSPRTLSGTAAPATGGHSTGRASASPSVSGTAQAGATTTASQATPRSTSTSARAGVGGGGRCHTSELRASVGRNDPGAGQENFPIVLTNTSARTCTVRGYPGAAFVDASGRQLGPDPKRESGTPTTVTLTPGKSAWAGMTFSNPGVSGAHTATPASLLVTPPDERDHLSVKWTGGPVPVSGNASSVFLMVFSPGTGP